MNIIDKIRTFFMEVITEMKKVSWITRKELIDSAFIVLAITILLIFFIAIADYFLVKTVTTFIK